MKDKLKEYFETITNLEMPKPCESADLEGCYQMGVNMCVEAFIAIFGYSEQ